MVELTFFQRLRLRLLGRAYLEHRIRPGWTAYHPFYAFKCPKHGIVVDYLHGFDGEKRLDCPHCLEEKWKYA